MIRRLIAVLCLVGIVTATALAAFKTGNYEGRTGRGAGVSFTANAKAVKNFTFSALLRCSNGQQIANTTTQASIPVRNSRFSLSTSTVTIRGSLSGSKASGTLSATEASAPGGGRNCKSGSQAWTATRRGLGHKNALVCAPQADFNGGDLQVDMSCGGGDFDAFVVRIPRPATRADTSTAHLRCLTGHLSGNGESTAIVNCSAQDGVKLRSGRVLIRFSDNATCADLRRSTVSALRVGPSGGEDGPFPIRSTVC